MRSALISPAERLGLNRGEAAEYFGVSPSTFDKMIAKGVMPPSKVFGARRIWDRRAIERAFANLPDDESAATIQDRSIFMDVAA